MSLLAGATAPVNGKSPIIMTLCGEPGGGKTSLAAEFPNAFIIRTQGEAMPRDVPNEKKPHELAPIGGRKTKQGDVDVWDEAELLDQLVALLREDHEYKTLIIDSITGLESLFVQNIIDVQPTKQKTMNAAGSGFGSAWDLVVAKHGRVKRAAELLRERKGMNVIFIAHVDLARIDPPEGEAYTKYDLQLNKKTAPVYTNNVDIVARLMQETVVMEGGKAKATGARVLAVTMSPAGVSKNRLGITKDIKYTRGENPFADYI